MKVSSTSACKYHGVGVSVPLRGVRDERVCLVETNQRPSRVSVPLRGVRDESRDGKFNWAEGA